MAKYNALNNIWGSNNVVTVVENGIERALDAEGINGLKISINGNNNRIRIGLPLHFNDCRLVVVGDNNSFSIQKSKTKIMKVYFFVADGCHIQIGKNSFFNNDISIIAKDKKGTKVILGNNCSISTECIIRCGDGNTIIDDYTGEALNMPRDVIIGNNVWLGTRVMILKGSHVPDNTIVGAMSLINSTFDETNTLIAGVPAKVIKRGVSWEKKPWCLYENKRAEIEYDE